MKTSLNLKFHRWHKRFGLALAVVTILWGLSGIAHPIMSRIKPIAQAQLPLEPINITELTGVPLILTKLGSVSDVLIINRYSAGPVVAVQLQSQENWLYFNAKTGQEISDFQSHYLPFIASLYAGIKEEQIESVTIVDGFSYDYPMVNRFLPAYKIQFKDELATTVYLDAQSLQLASISNKYKAFYTQWFSHLHSWDFIPNTTFRYSLMFLVTVLLFLSALLGIYLSIHHWRKGVLHKGSKSRRAHRYIGLFVCLAALAFSFSGGFHAFGKLIDINYERIIPHKSNHHNAIQTGEFISLWNNLLQQNNIGNINQIQLIRVNGHPVLQLHHLTEVPNRPGMHQHGTHERLIRGDVSYLPQELIIDGDELSTQLLYLQQLINKESHKVRIVDARLQPHFNHEYSFIDKKLPVYRIQTEHNIYFFDPTAQTLSKTVNHQKLLENWSFSTLHKASFLDGLGKDIRDIIIVLFVLGIIVITILGLTMSIKRKVKPSVQD